MKEVAVIKTSKGEMTVDFWSDVAPKTVENFKALAKKGFYNGTAFHRIIKGFMIQGGDPNTKDPSKEGVYGMGDPGYKIKAEFNDKKHERGVLSMARSMDPDSAGSQFFICLDPAPFLDRQYTGFGRVVKGEDVLLKIGDTPVASNGRERSKPTERVTVENVKITFNGIGETYLRLILNTTSSSVKKCFALGKTLMSFRCLTTASGCLKKVCLLHLLLWMNLEIPVKK
jgi:peptidyl-prolyl cis-trans isomerase B (cyclophilin B)